MHVIPKSNYTLDASERTITLISPYNNLELSQLITIFDIDTNDMVYDVEIKRNGVEIVDGVISYSSDSNIVSDADDLRISINSTDNVVTQHTYNLVDRGLLFRNFIKMDTETTDVVDILIVTGAKYAHCLFNAVSDGDTKIEIYAGTVTSDDGDEENSGNFNFNSSNTAVTKWYTSPAITNVGAYVAQTWILGGSGVGTPAAAKASASMEGLDVVLIPNMKFTLRFTNLAVRDMQTLFEVNFRESDYDIS